MEQEIYIADGIGGEHRVKYLDENRVIVQTVTRYKGDDNAGGLYDVEDHITYSMPAKVKLYQIDTFPYTDILKEQILSFHAQFIDAK